MCPKKDNCCLTDFLGLVTKAPDANWSSRCAGYLESGTSDCCVRTRVDTGTCARLGKQKAVKVTFRADVSSATSGLTGNWMGSIVF